ncbi:uncharacterized protein CMC5_023510 [Chondromyces crocatus]|uniref:Uncharacterized protein n=1 Tax=Chondromyces crocatus TaxID=52 RepID=A0A0K1ECB8_CHOCO|nr:uncharacterized protein CMC5_023510 [Chondromyces crocatus]
MLSHIVLFSGWVDESRAMAPPPERARTQGQANDRAIAWDETRTP